MISAKNEKTMGEEKVMDRKMTEKEFENRCMDVIESIASLDIGQEKEKNPDNQAIIGIFYPSRQSHIFFTRMDKPCF